MMTNPASDAFPEAYIRTFRQALGYLLGVFRRNILLIGIIVLLATAAGAGAWYSRAPYFESDLVCAFNNQRFPRKTFGEMAQKLHKLAQSGSATELARILQLSPKQAAAIIAVEGKNKAGSPLHEDITEQYEPLYFTVRATEKQVFVPLEKGMVEYMSGTPQLKLLERLSVKNLSQRIGLLEQDLRKTDSVIDAYAVAIRSGAIFRDTSAGHSDVVEALRYRIEVEDRLTAVTHKIELERGNTVFVMHGFAPPDHPTRGSKKMIAAAALIGLLAACCLALFRDKTPQPANA